MLRLLTFVRQKANRTALAFLGSGLVVVAGGLWFAFTQYFPPGKPEGPKPAATTNSGVVAERDATGNVVSNQSGASISASNGVAAGTITGGTFQIPGRAPGEAQKP